MTLVQAEGLLPYSMGTANRRRIGAVEHDADCGRYTQDRVVPLRNQSNRK